jgi:hypothetical protein
MSTRPVPPRLGYFMTDPPGRRLCGAELSVGQALSR